MALMATSGKDWKRWDALFWSQSRVALPWIWKRLRGEAPSHILPTGYLGREFLPGEGGGRFVGKFQIDCGRLQWRKEVGGYMRGEKKLRELGKTSEGSSR